MRGVKDIVNSVVTALNGISGMTMNADKKYPGGYGDSPLSGLITTVGVRSLHIEAGKLSAYSGLEGYNPKYSLPIDIEIEIIFHISTESPAYMLYNAVSFAADMFFSSTAFNVLEINCEAPHYDRTSLCVAMPMLVRLRDRIAGDTTGGTI